MAVIVSHSPTRYINITNAWFGQIMDRIDCIIWDSTHQHLVFHLQYSDFVRLSGFLFFSMLLSDGWCCISIDRDPLRWHKHHDGQSWLEISAVLCVLFWSCIQHTQTQAWGHKAWWNMSMCEGYTDTSLQHCSYVQNMNTAINHFRMLIWHKSSKVT